MTAYEELWRARFGEGAPDAPSDGDLQRLMGFLSRRSCRAFKSDPIDEALLASLLTCAQAAPSKSDLQQYSIIAIDDPSIRASMQEWSSFDPWIADAPLFLVFCGDLRRQRRIAALRGYEHRNDNMDTFMNTAVDAGIALATFVAAAEAVGLGCCPISVVRNHIEEACALLELPEGVYPVAGLALGWPARDGHISMRLPPAAVVHRNRYNDDAFEAVIDGYDQARHAVYAIPPEKQRHRDKYGTGGCLHLVGERGASGIGSGTGRVPGVSHQARFRARLSRTGKQNKGGRDAASIDHRRGRRAWDDAARGADRLGGFPAA